MPVPYVHIIHSLAHLYVHVYCAYIDRKICVNVHLCMHYLESLCETCALAGTPAQRVLQKLMPAFDGQGHLLSNLRSPHEHLCTGVACETVDAASAIVGKGSQKH